ncbi:hypothetical protein Ahy_A03g011845 [Arachis hypogaea]|uniref:Uncharacterized protein n=1 Tax=Arachis hypogaea TaxID=3818 RepID=A0A445DS25_ARAHY|nr:hypothetical protein Ahy_A03g011845 [Arachis hypogaea]
MANVKRINIQVCEYLSKFKQEQWFRSKFSKWPKVDNLTGNNCESFNSQLWNILTILEEFKFYIMKTIATNKDALMAYIKKLALRKDKLTIRKHNGLVMISTTNLKLKNDNIEIATIQKKNEKPENYVHHKLTIKLYDRIYQFHFNSILSQEYWEQHKEFSCLPLPYKRPIDRPTKKRAKNIIEQCFGSQYNAKKRYGQITCQTCNTVGHNSRICPERLTKIAIEMQDIDEEEVREQEASYTVYVADEEQLTQNYPQTQPKESTINNGTTITIAPSLNTDTILTVSNLVTVATGSKTASQVTTRPTILTTIRRGRPTFVRGNLISARGRGSTFWKRVATTLTIPPTPIQYAVATPPLEKLSITLFFIRRLLGAHRFYFKI